MSYLRWGPSDVYLFANVSGALTCCGCILFDGQTFDAWSTQEMVDHLAAHRTAGDYVPEVEPDLWADDAENFPKEEL